MTRGRGRALRRVGVGLKILHDRTVAAKDRTVDAAALLTLTAAGRRGLLGDRDDWAEVVEEEDGYRMT